MAINTTFQEVLQPSVHWVVGLGAVGPSSLLDRTPSRVLACTSQEPGRPADFPGSETRCLAFASRYAAIIPSSEGQFVLVKPRLWRSGITADCTANVSYGRDVRVKRSVREAGLLRGSVLVGKALKREIDTERHVRSGMAKGYGTRVALHPSPVSAASRAQRFHKTNKKHCRFVMEKTCCVGPDRIVGVSRLVDLTHVNKKTFFSFFLTGWGLADALG